MRVRRASVVWLAVFPVILCFCLGCLNKANRAEETMETSLIHGLLPPGTQGSVLLRREDWQQRVSIDSNTGQFACQVRPGRYQILLEGPTKTLSLIHRDLLVEDGATMSLLEVQLVPIPKIVSVAIPLLYDNAAVIEWETDIEADGRVEYGRDQHYGAALSTDAELKKRHRVQLHTLDPDTTYHFRIVTTRHALEITEFISGDHRFTTAPSAKASIH